MLVVLVTVSEALSTPALGSLVVGLSWPGRLGAAFGAVGLARAIGSFVGTALGAVLLQLASDSRQLWPFWGSLALAFGLPAGVALVVGLFLASRPREAKTAPTLARS
jgi:MFS family permease